MHCVAPRSLHWQIFTHFTLPMLKTFQASWSGCLIGRQRYSSTKYKNTNLVTWPWNPEQSIRWFSGIQILWTWRLLKCRCVKYLSKKPRVEIHGGWISQGPAVVSSLDGCGALYSTVFHFLFYLSSVQSHIEFSPTISGLLTDLSTLFAPKWLPHRWYPN